MCSSAETGGAIAVPVAALQYRDMTNRAEREFAIPMRMPNLGGAEKGDGSAASTHLSTEIAAKIERERAGAALEVEQRLRKEYDQKLLAERAEIVQLALSIAAKILHRESQVDPMLVAALVRIAVGKMREGSSVTLRVSPSRADRWRHYFAEIPGMAHVEIAEDAHLSDQDCMVGTELGSANFGLDTQLKEVEQGFFDLLALRPASR
jgi:flagellar assembly protein FliH